MCNSFYQVHHTILRYKQMACLFIFPLYDSIPLEFMSSNKHRNWFQISEFQYILILLNFMK